MQNSLHLFSATLCPVCAYDGLPVISLRFYCGRSHIMDCNSPISVGNNTRNTVMQLTSVPRVELVSTKR